MFKKVSDLTGAALDRAVALAEGRVYGLPGTIHAFSPSTKWSQGGPIIEREGIYLRTIRKEGHQLHEVWLAAPADSNTGTIVQWVKRESWPKHYFTGPTPLIAAMRCYVASKLGNTVEIPDEIGAKQ